MGKRKQHRARPNRYLSEDERKNDLMRDYYKGQFGWTDDQWDSFYTIMRTELPATFRVTGFRDQSREVHWLIRNEFLERLSSEDVATTTRGPSERLATPLAWYPGELAYQLGASKLEIRKNPLLKRLHRFLVSETESGFISRQEAVSMLPPLLLDIEAHHRVLDLCAAPGSKTAQLVEMLHAGLSASDSERGALPSGLVVANDVDSKRCYMMVHQLQRLQSPCVVVVRQDASIFPRLYLASDADADCHGDGDAPLQSDPTKRAAKPTQLMFDRILADVPCSGDGTLRKNQDLWPRWSPMLGVNEHFLQIKILRRALEMLADGGKVVYSTCSLNPIEDEAVVAAVLAQCAGAARLVDIDHKLNGLRADPGMSEWRVMLKDRSWCSALEQVPSEQRRSLRASLFPPANIAELHIDRCRRIMPYHQNTGGFFLALIEKVAPLPWMKQPGRPQQQSPPPPPAESGTVPNESESPQSEPIVPEIAAPVPKAGPPAAKRARVFREDPFLYLGDAGDLESVWEPVRDYYGIASEFPARQLLYRNADGRRRNYYFTNALVRRLVRACNQLDQSDGRNSSNGGGVNLVNLGVKLLALSDEKAFAGYRVLQDGVDLLAPFVGTARRLRLGCRDDLVRLLSYDMPLASEFSAQLQAGFATLSTGPVLFEYVPTPMETATVTTGGDCELPRIPLVFAGWRGRSSLRHYVGVHERSHLQRLCGLEPVEELPAARAYQPGSAAALDLHPSDSDSDCAAAATGDPIGDAAGVHDNDVSHDE